MAFSEEELKSIRHVVRDFCERRIPAEIRDEVCLLYAIEGQSVIIRELRPAWREPSKWTEMDVAKLRFIRKSNEWKLYWKRASGKWWLYKPRSRSRTLAAMIREIDADEYGCFFG
jgi:hypothetical protein